MKESSPRGRPGPDLRAWLLRLPLVTPYKLAFGSVEALDTIVVHVDNQGVEGFGEATLLTGYTDETIGATWEKAVALVEADRSPGFDLAAALDSLDGKHPFLTTAFRTALEMADNDPRLSLDAPTQVPILGLLQGSSGEHMQREADKLVRWHWSVMDRTLSTPPFRAEILDRVTNVAPSTRPTDRARRPPLPAGP